MQALDGVSFTLQAGRSLGIVGESGSGKSVTMLALMGLVGFPGQVRARRMRFAGHDLPGLSARERQIVMHLGEGRTSKEIARMLTISPRTVEAYRARLTAREAYQRAFAREEEGRLALAS